MAITKTREQKLKDRVFAERAAAGDRRVRFSKQIQQEAVALAMASKRSRDELATAIGVGKTSLHKWISAVHGSQRRRSRKTRLHRIEVTGSAPSRETEELRLTFPSGVQLSGVSMTQLRVLLGVSA